MSNGVEAVLLQQAVNNHRNQGGLTFSYFAIYPPEQQEP
jgi:hypothetical protein